MSHGIEHYFAELAANRRRVALSQLAVAGVLAAVLFVGGRRVAQSVLDDPKRFGFEGPRQWVERIRLEELANRESSGLYEVTYLTAEARKGGRKKLSDHPDAPPVVVQVEGTGNSEMDLIAKARMLALEAPVIRSEDLIIERLVRPEYPSEARDRNIEGVVELIALVDTSGSVVQVQMLGHGQEPLLEQAAAKAILACRFRPYKVADQARQVWAAYRIAFSLY